jgi:hypothetical protein
MMLSIIAIAAALLLFAAGPVLTTHQAYACWGGGCFTYGGWGVYSYGGFVSSGGFGGW